MQEPNTPAIKMKLKPSLHSGHAHQRHLFSAALAFGLLSTAAVAQDAPGIVGKSGWLYYKYELTSGQDTAAISTSVDLIQRINRVFQKNGVAVVVAMVPLKVRIHPEGLPPSAKLTDSLKGQYGRIQKSLNDAGVLTADLNAAFLNSPNRLEPMPLFFKQDTHWSAPGALVAAETIRDTVNAQATLKSALDATTLAPYKLTWATQEPIKKGDLVAQLPKGSPGFEGETIKYFEVDKIQGTESAGLAALTGNTSTGITLVGSSYTHEWTKFPGAVSFALQRDILSISVDASQGQWVGLHTYLRDDSFQTTPPKLLIWEMPERDMAAPPQYKWRDQRYSMDNVEWLLQASALVQRQCAPAGISAKIESASLGAAANAANGIEAKPTTAQDFVDISFDKPLDQSHYISAKLLNAGSKTLTTEASGTATTARKTSLSVAGDDAEHNFRLALLPKGKGFNKLRIYPGNASNFSLKDLQVCAQPSDL